MRKLQQFSYKLKQDHEQLRHSAVMLELARVQGGDVRRREWEASRAFTNYCTKSLEFLVPYFAIMLALTISPPFGDPERHVMYEVLARVYWVFGFGLHYFFVRYTLKFLVYHFYFRFGYHVLIGAIVVFYTFSSMVLLMGLTMVFPIPSFGSLPPLPHFKLVVLLATLIFIAAVSCTAFWGVHGHPLFMRASGEQKLFALLPISKRGELVSVSADDHYVNIKTSRGSAHIRLKFSAALEMLAESDGIQVHRSHWVNLNAVTDLKTGRDGKPVIKLLDGSEIPVAKARKKVLKSRLAAIAMADY